MEYKRNGFILLLCLFLLLCACSERIIRPPASAWHFVPCEYRLEGDDLSILLVRAQVADFDSVKANVQIISWTVLGDTLSQTMTLYPLFNERSESYSIFTFERCLPINSVLRSVELYIKI